ncbi:hypothetical protein ACHAPU_008925 [Fusarium lateritium]
MGPNELMHEITNSLVRKMVRSQMRKKHRAEQLERERQLRLQTENTTIDMDVHQRALIARFPYHGQTFDCYDDPRRRGTLSMETALESTQHLAEDDSTTFSIRVLNPQRPTVTNIVEKVQGLENTWAGTVDNLQALVEIYDRVPSAKVSVIMAAIPSVPVSTARLSWDILKSVISVTRFNPFSQTIPIFDPQ